MAHVTVRLATPKDAAIIIEFNIAMARETEEKVLAFDILSAGVHAVMENSQLGFYLVAEAAGEIAGCLLVTSEWSDWRNGLFWWIQSVYVRKKFRRQGIYAKMFEFLNRKADQRPEVCGFRLYVAQNNLAAHKTYAALGMHQTPYRIYEVSKD